MRLALFFVAALGAPSALAGEISGLPGGFKCADLLNNGALQCAFEINIDQIKAETASGLRALLSYRNERRSMIYGSAAILNSPGGSVMASLEIGRILRSEKISAVVPSNGSCVSACVFVLTGATSRLLQGRVGIHRPYTATSPNNPESVASNYVKLVAAMRAYMEEMSASPALVDEMLRIAPDDIRYLSRTELREYGIGEAPPTKNAEQLAALREALSVRSAQAYGISPQEYRRRSRLVDRNCRLGLYDDPEGPLDLSQYGETLEQSAEAPVQRLRRHIELEERNWSRCFKNVMTRGR